MRTVCIIAALFIFLGILNAQTDNVSRKKPSQSAPKSNTTKKSSPRPSATRPASNNGASRTVAPSFGKVAQQKISSKSFTVNGVTFDMMRVEAGTFTMGATSEMSDPHDVEKPTHQVILTGNYFIGKTEVTQKLWKAVMGYNSSHFQGENLPLDNVSWDDCMRFISKLNSMTGQDFRLPSEAEWEFAARGGNNSNHFQYSGSNKLEDVAWFSSNSDSKTHDVATKLPNELGIYDMSGNVWEWCADYWSNYSNGQKTNPTGPYNGIYRMLRGGSWCYDARGCRSSCRIRSSPDYRDSLIGFRLAFSE